MRFEQQQQVADELRWLHMRDLAPEEFLSWVLEWGGCAVRARLGRGLLNAIALKAKNWVWFAWVGGCFAALSRHKAAPTRTASNRATASNGAAVRRSTERLKAMTLNTERVPENKIMRSL